MLRRYPDKLFGFVWLSPLERHGPGEHRQAESVDRRRPHGRHEDGWNRWCLQYSGVYPVFERASQLKALIFIHAWFKTGAG